MLKSDVFDRLGTDVLSRRTFNLIMCSTITWGFVLTAILANACEGWNPGWMGALVVGLVVPLAGIVLSMSGNAFVSFLGFNLVAGGFGCFLGPVLHVYEIGEPGIVKSAAALTAVVVAVMGTSGVIYPRFYERIGGTLFVALLSLLVVRIVGIFVPAIGSAGIVDWCAAGLFSLYVGYDVHRSTTIPTTSDNAIDCALALYLDVLNLFLNVLNITSSKD